LTCELDKPASYEEICATIKATAEGAMKGTLQYTEDMVVSSDFRSLATGVEEQPYSVTKVTLKTKTSIFL
jgi:glyceraldehyde-3-phosphate dehydrogenase/erythrose-4-phosphate dehydrogenase